MSTSMRLTGKGGIMRMARRSAGLGIRGATFHFPDDDSLDHDDDAPSSFMMV